MEIFDGKVWRNGPKMPTPRYSAAAVVIPMEFSRHLKELTVGSTESCRCSVQ